MQGTLTLTQSTTEPFKDLKLAAGNFQPALPFGSIVHSIRTSTDTDTRTITITFSYKAP